MTIGRTTLLLLSAAVSLAATAAPASAFLDAAATPSRSPGPVSPSPHRRRRVLALLGALAVAGAPIVAGAQETPGSTDTTAPVTAPADGTIIEVSSLGSPTSHRVVISHGCDLVSVYMVVNQLTGPLAALAAEVGAGGQVQVSIPVSTTNASATTVRSVR